MKIERISENQIRCTLNKADLEEKELLLTELAYGTDKAKKLFSEMMQQASEELGFEVDNIPLMIEAIPVSKECLILVVTKVEDPEELDTRFSRFTKTPEKQESDSLEEDDELSTGVNLSDVNNSEALVAALGSLAEGLSALNNKRNKKARIEKGPIKEGFIIYVFKNISEITYVAKMVNGIYMDENTLYKNPRDNSYYLYLKKSSNKEVEFAAACNIMDEFANRMNFTYATPDYMQEHFNVIINLNAIQTLATL